MIPLAVLVAVAFCTACAHLLLKRVSLASAGFSWHLLQHRQFLLAVALFGVCPLLSIWALQYVDFTLYYATTALNYVFVIILARLLRREHIDWRKALGCTLIVLGLILCALPAA